MASPNHPARKFEHRIGAALETWVETSARFAWPVVVAATVITLGLAWYTATHISVRTDTDEMIDPKLPFRAAYAEFNAAFPQLADSFLIVVEGAAIEDVDQAVHTLSATLATKKNQFQSIRTPGLGLFFDQNALLLLSKEDLYAVADNLASAQGVLAALAASADLATLFDILAKSNDLGSAGFAEAALYKELERAWSAAQQGKISPVSWQSLVAPEDSGLKTATGNFRRFIVVQPALDPSRLQPAKPALREAERLADELRAQWGDRIRIDFTGKIALNTEELKSVQQGAGLAAGLSAILVALILAFGVRSFRLVFAMLVTVFVGLIWTAAFAIMAIGYLNIISVAFAVLFIGLGVDFAIHYALRVREEAHPPHDLKFAFRRAASGSGIALLLCAPTTALAFFAFVPTSYVGLSQLGLISGMGLFISVIVTFTLIPSLLSLWGTRSFRQAANQSAIGQSVFHRFRKPMAILGLSAAAGAGILVPDLAFDFDPLKLKDQKSPSVIAFRALLNEGKAAPYAGQFLVPSSQAAEAIVEAAKSLGTVDKSIWLGSYVANAQQDKLDAIEEMGFFLDPVFRSRSDERPKFDFERDRSSLFQFLDGSTSDNATNRSPRQKFAERVSASKDAVTPKTLELFSRNVFVHWTTLLDALAIRTSARPYTVDDLPADLKRSYRADDGRYRIEVLPRENLAKPGTMARFVADLETLAYAPTGSPVQILGSGRVVKQAMGQATLTAAIVISIFLIIIFRDIATVLLILAPVLIAGLLTAGIAVLLGLSLNFANVIVLPLLIGLGVDNGIHLVMRAREQNDKAGLERGSTRRAVFLSALTTAASFGTLAVSSHQGTASMGLLLSVAIGCILFTSLIILPELLRWVRR